MRCEICGEDKSGLMIVVDKDGRYVACPDCTRLMAQSFRNRDKTDGPDESDKQAG